MAIIICLYLQLKSRSGHLSSSLTSSPRQNPNNKQNDNNFPCKSLELNFVYGIFFSSLSNKGGYHELQNEPDGVKEKLAEAIISFIDNRLASSTPEEAQSGSEPHAPETTNSADVGESAKAKM